MEAVLLFPWLGSMGCRWPRIFVKLGVAVCWENVQRMRTTPSVGRGLRFSTLALSLANTSLRVPRLCVSRDCSFVDNDIVPISIMLASFATFENLATR